MPSDSQQRTALFISHATPDDNHFVRWLGAKLTAMGYEVWADVMNLHGGIDWARELEVALRKRAVKMLLVCTPTGLDRQGVRNEIEIGVALSKQLHDDAFVIPLRLEPFEPPFRIAQAQYIDFWQSWAQGLAELVELLEAKAIPHADSGALTAWLTSHADGSDRLLDKPQPLVSNWLKIAREPRLINFIESPVGGSLAQFQNRSSSRWPIVPHRGGVLTYAEPETASDLDLGSQGIKTGNIDLQTFLESGWAELGIPAGLARKIYSDLGSQAFERYCRSRGLKEYLGSGKRISWWGDLRIAPVGQVKFDWSYRRGSRQIVGQSGKRGVHWHYAASAQLRTSPLRHFRIATRLVFSLNGMEAIEDVKRSHTLRRSFAKGWRNPRWRDMLCAYLWWLSDGKAEMALPVGANEQIFVTVPPMQFSSPVSVQEGADIAPDEDDPDVPDDEWSNEPHEGAEE